MTIIAAVVNPAGVWLGGDSLSSNDDLRTGTSSPKVFKFDEFLIGFAGSWASSQGMLATFRNDKVKTVRQLSSGYSVPSDVDVLLADVYGVYEFVPGGGLVKMRARQGISYGAMGVGAGVALGSLFSWNDAGRDSLLSALRASEAHTNHVRRPFKILQL